MKRIMAALLALLMLLLSGCVKAKAPQVTPTPTPQKSFEWADGALKRREDIRTLVICAVAYDQEGNSKLSSVNVLVKNGDGELAILTIPKDTRVWVEEYDAAGEYQYCRYGAISEVYHAAESAHLGEAKVMETVSALLGGVRLDHYMLLNVVQLEQLAELAGKVMIMSDSVIAEYGIPAGFQDITPKIREYASYSYLNSLGGVEYSGTDPYKLQRHQQLIETMLSVFVNKTGRLEPEEKIEYAQSIQQCVTTDMDWEAVMSWIGDDMPTITEVSILKGIQNERRSESYWICDQSAVKEWVIAKFYLTEEE